MGEAGQNPVGNIPLKHAKNAVGGELRYCLEVENNHDLAHQGTIANSSSVTG